MGIVAPPAVIPLSAPSRAQSYLSMLSASDIQTLPLPELLHTLRVQIVEVDFGFLTFGAAQEVDGRILVGLHTDLGPAQRDSVVRELLDELHKAVTQ